MKKSWRSWSHPKKGALIGVLVFAALYILLIILPALFSILTYQPPSEEGPQYSTGTISEFVFIYHAFIPGFTSIIMGFFAAGFAGTPLIPSILWTTIPVIIAYALAGAFLGWTYSKIKNKNHAKLVICLLIILVYALSTYGQYRALHGPNYENYSVADCGKIKDLSTQEICYLKVATAKIDTSICEKISKDSTAYGSCYYNVLSEDLNILGTTSLCEQVPASEARDNCYYWIARDGNVSICEQIQNPDAKLECINDASP